MRITLAELELHRIVATESYPPGSLDYHDTAFRQAAPLQFQVTAELQGGEIHIRGHLSTTLEAACDRCLSRVELPVDSHFDLLYQPMQTIAKEEVVEIPKDEMEVGFFQGDGIELAEVATEQVILSVPMKVVCRSECRGLCPGCGANLNLTQCNCSAGPKSDSPFASLA